MESAVERVYPWMPRGIQDTLVSIEGWRVGRQRFGAEFLHALGEFRERERWSEDQVTRFRQSRLPAALERASRTEYYGRLFQELGGCWQDFTDPDEFKKIPVTHKEDVQANVGAFRARQPAKDDVLIKTSGTTGASLALPVSRNVEPEQWAVWWRYRRWHGIRRGTPCALFASAPIVPQGEGARFWRRNSAGREYRFSVYHISASTVSSYVSSLNELRAPWIHGNPSAISLLASYMLDQGLKLDYRLSWLTVGSENLLPWQRDAMTQAFGGNPVQHYGLAEAVANISECERSSLHTDEDYSYVEYVADAADGTHRIIGTPFSNEAVGLLRYDTGDLATPLAQGCSCGRWGRTVEALNGRSADYVTLPNGERIASLASPFHGTSGLAEAQIYQDAMGNLTIRYVPGYGWDDSVLPALERKLRDRVGSEIPMEFRCVDRVERTRAGKVKLVLSDYELSQ